MESRTENIHNHIILLVYKCLKSHCRYSNIVSNILMITEFLFNDDCGYKFHIDASRLHFISNLPGHEEEEEEKNNNIPSRFTTQSTEVFFFKTTQIKCVQKLKHHYCNSIEIVMQTTQIHNTFANGNSK